MKKIILFVIALMLTMSCAIPVLPIPTAQAYPSVNPVEPTRTPVIVLPTATLTNTPTITPTPTPTFTPTPGKPMFTVNIDSNCRSGPSKDYPILEGIYNGESVPILGQTTLDRPTWWYVQKDGINCWVSGILGATSGNLVGIPYVVAPPIPTPTRTEVEVIFENNTDGSICRMDFYVGIDIVARFTWSKGEFKNDGMDAKVFLPIGGYDLIEAYDCKSNFVTSLTEVVINKDNHAFSLD